MNFHCSCSPFCQGGDILSREADYQSKLIHRIKDRLPDSFVIKMDPSHNQGMPDLLVLNKERWALLEVKRSEKDRQKPRPNQEYYVEKFNNMGFSAFIFPENEEEVLNAMERSFES